MGRIWRFAQHTAMTLVVLVAFDLVPVFADDVYRTVDGKETLELRDVLLLHRGTTGHAPSETDESLFYASFEGSDVLEGEIHILSQIRTVRSPPDERNKLVASWKEFLPRGDVTDSRGSKVSVLSLGYKPAFLSGWFNLGMLPIKSRWIPFKSDAQTASLDFKNIKRIMLKKEQFEVTLKDGMRHVGWLAPNPNIKGDFVHRFVGYLDEQDSKTGFFRPFSIPVRDVREIVVR